jgi:DNA modification methylase
MPDFKIIQGAALPVLRSMPDESVHCCVTSPPYWGLRSYGTEPQVWGGLQDCGHEWGDEQLRGGPAGKQGATGQRADRRNVAEQESGSKSQGAWCQLCGAWRGELGLEPTPELFVEHTVEVFREVRRVLRADGTLWLNIGDSYNANQGKQNLDVLGQEYAGGGHKASRSLTNTVRPRPDWLKPKDLVGIPWMLAFALRADGWYLRSDIVWHKPNPMPESVNDRPTKSHEYIFLLSKSERYHYDAEAIKEKSTGTAHDRSRKERSMDGQKTVPTGERNGIRAPGVNPKSQKWPNGWSAEAGRHDGIGDGRFRPKQNASFSAAVVGIVEFRNKRSVWTVPTEAYPEAHFATFPKALVRPCILAGCPKGGTVLEPFTGSGTTLEVAMELGCNAIGIELQPDYIPLIEKRLAQDVLPLETSHGNL